MKGLKKKLMGEKESKEGKREKGGNLGHRRRTRGNEEQKMMSSQLLTQIWLMQPCLIIKVIVFIDTEMYLLYNIVLTEKNKGTTIYNSTICIVSFK